MLKYRLLFGTMMIFAFFGLILLDGYLDGSLTQTATERHIQGWLFAIMIALLTIPAHLELENLIKNTGGNVFKCVTIPASFLLSTAFFWPQFTHADCFFSMYILLVPALSLLALFIFQAMKFGSEGTISNISGSFFSIMYLGFLSMFVLGIRIGHGTWVLLMFIFTVKASDIGAYTLGRLFGKHKLCPQISPGKTWEGLAGAMLFGGVVSLGFSYFCDIMTILQAVIFGLVFGILGQLGDLVESMIKRDAESKDSSSSIPGFGGLLDVIDSPLATAPLAFAYFHYII